MQFEQLEQAHSLAGGGHHPQVTVWFDQHESGGSDVEHVHAPVGKPCEHLDRVEVGHQRVGQLHERPGEHLFAENPWMPALPDTDP